MDTRLHRLHRLKFTLNLTDASGDVWDVVDGHICLVKRFSAGTKVNIPFASEVAEEILFEARDILKQKLRVIDLYFDPKDKEEVGNGNAGEAPD